MMDIKAQQVKMRGKAISRDKLGRPKVPKHRLRDYWPFLTEDDRKYLLELYEHGNHAPDRA